LVACLVNLPPEPARPRAPRAAKDAGRTLAARLAALYLHVEAPNESGRVRVNARRNTQRNTRRSIGCFFGLRRSLSVVAFLVGIASLDRAPAYRSSRYFSSRLSFSQPLPRIFLRSRDFSFIARRRAFGLTVSPASESAIAISAQVHPRSRAA